VHKRALLSLLCPPALVLAGCGSGEQRAHTFATQPALHPPKLEVVSPARNPTEGYVFLAPKRHAEQIGVLIADDRGEPVWTKPVSPEAADFRVQVFRGNRVLTWWQGHSAKGYGRGEYVIVDASYRRIATVRAAHGLKGDEHEFTLTPRGTALITAYRHVGTLLDGVVQEIDVATGRLVFEWHSVGHVGSDESYFHPGKKKTPLDPGDYFHVNSVALEQDGNLLVSARNTSAIYKIARRTGRIIWRLGGKRSDFRLGEGTHFMWQHDARRRADGNLTLFDDGAAPPVEPRSRALVLHLDEQAMKATLVAARVHPGTVLATSQGNAQPLPGGGFFVGWGSEPYATEFDAEGRVVLDVRLPHEVDSYRAYRSAWVGRPRTRPTLVVRRRDLDENRVSASWNGATEVAQWAVLAGDDASRLRERARAPRDGFETTIGVARGFRWYAVRALSRDGRTLGRSPIVDATVTAAE